MKGFTKNHTWKYALDYHNCYNSPAFEALPTVEGKDRVYQACHDKLLAQMKETVRVTLTCRWCLS